MTDQSIKVTYLLAVWGDQYIRQFMDLSLRSLLASGNIPTVAGQTESTFVFLTRKCDQKIFSRHAMFRRLEHHCKVVFVPIDDLIFGGNYSATLTLAYERGMRQAGTQMLSTYFIYLVADYVVADGAFANLLPYMQRGVSAITAGNYQAIEENMLEMIQQRVNPITGVLSLPPRELVALTLPHLHPTTVANIVNQDYSHTEHTNRLFWRVDEQTLLGRFYLRHMLCIKPEIDNYVIGASCDYSFVPEMCPSGNVVHLTDSDEYCVVELQPFAHENLVRPGAFVRNKMLQSLNEWTTRDHRGNVQYPVIFHAGAVSDKAQAMILQSQHFVDGLARDLSADMPSTRAHPYWVSCLEGILRHLLQPRTKREYFKDGVFAGIVGSPVFEQALGICAGDYQLLKTKRYQFGRNRWRDHILRAMRTLAGDDARCSFWHREYAHSRLMRKTIDHVARGTKQFLFIAFEPTGYAAWCQKHFGGRVALHKSDLFYERSALEIQVQSPHATHAVVLLPVAEIHKLGDILEKCRLCLIGERRVTILVVQHYIGKNSRPLRVHLATLAAFFNNAAVHVESYIAVTCPLRSWLDVFYRQQVNAILYSGITIRAMFRRVLAIVWLGIAMTGYIISNLISIRGRYPGVKNPTCAAITVRLR